MTTVIKHIDRDDTVLDRYASCDTSISLDDYKLRIHGIHGGGYEDYLMILEEGQGVEITMSGRDMW